MHLMQEVGQLEHCHVICCVRIVLGPDLIEECEVGRGDERGRDKVEGGEVLEDNGDDEVEEYEGAHELEGN